MSDAITRPVAAGGAADTAAVRPDRRDLIAFVTDAATEAALRDALSDGAPAGLEIRRSTIRGAIAALRRMASPHTLIVDISGEAQPLAAIAELSDVVEPDIRVLLIGDRSDANFYRQVTRGLGVLEYIYKPLQREMISRYFGPLVLNGNQARQTGYGGSVISVTGMRGGVGASTIAANLAWHFGVDANRHTVVLDGDLHRGTCAMLLGANTTPELRTALETPEYIDEPFLERAAQPVRARLHVLAGEVASGEAMLSEPPAHAAGATARLLDVLRRRYNFVVVDLPFSDTPMHRDLLMSAHHRILVMDPTLASVRDTLRLLALPNGAMQTRRAMVVLNRVGRPGSLTRRQVEKALKLKVDVAVPDLSMVLGRGAVVGDPAVCVRGDFRNGIHALAREIALLHLGESMVGVEGGTRKGGLRGFGSRLLGLGQQGPVPARPSGLAQPGVGS